MGVIQGKYLEMQQRAYWLPLPLLEDAVEAQSRGIGEEGNHSLDNLACSKQSLLWEGAAPSEGHLWECTKMAWGISTSKWCTTGIVGT